MKKNKIKPILIIFNIPNNKKILKIILNKLLFKKIICCINYIKKIKSYYIWKKKLTIKTEIKIICKSFIFFKKKIINLIEKYHPYKTPEIIFLNIKYINNKYFEWMKNILLKK